MNNEPNVGICLECKKQFKSDTELMLFCSLDCLKAIDKEHTENKRDKITINIAPMVDVTFTYKQLADLHFNIGYILHERRQKRLKDLGYEKPGPDTVTVGDLVGLKREDF